VKVRSIGIAAALTAVLGSAACGGRQQDARGADGDEFGTPTGPTLFDYHETPGPTPPDPSNPMPPPPPGPEPSPYIWMPEGQRLDNAAAGFGGVLADSSTVQLTDGRWRMFLYAGGQYRSAVSQDGLSFAMDPGTRLPEGFGHVRVLRLPGGRIRAFSSTNDGIVSHVSGDEGITFTREAGVRLSSSTIGFTPSGLSNVVRTREGMWRAYFSDLPRPGEGVLPHKILSATSADLLTWILDPGVRIGLGATLDGNGEHPAAIANPDGSVSLFYFRNVNFKMLMASASDGLTFTAEFDSGITNANDPDLIPLADGSVRMYYNWGNDAGGEISSALYVGTPFGASARPPILSEILPSLR